MFRLTEEQASVIKRVDAGRLSYLALAMFMYSGVETPIET
jgi:hypothetical protein